MTGDSSEPLTLAALHQRLAAVEQAQATVQSAGSPVSSPLTLSVNGPTPPTAEELEQAAREGTISAITSVTILFSFLSAAVESDRRLIRLKGIRKHRSSVPTRSASGMRENVNGNSSDSTATIPSSADGTPETALTDGRRKNPRRKLVWAGVATLMVLSLSLALPLLAPRLSLLNRLLRPLRSCWPLSLSFSRLSPQHTAGGKY